MTVSLAGESFLDIILFLNLEKLKKTIVMVFFYNKKSIIIDTKNGTNIDYYFYH